MVSLHLDDIPDQPTRITRARITHLLTTQAGFGAERGTSGAETRIGVPSCGFGANGCGARGRAAFLARSDPWLRSGRKWASPQAPSAAHPACRFVEIGSTTDIADV